MYTHAEKSQRVDDKPASMSANGGQSVGVDTTRFGGISPGVLAQQGLQAMIEDSAPVRQLRAVNDMIRESPRVKQAPPYQAMASEYASRQRGIAAMPRRSGSRVFSPQVASNASANVIQGAFINKRGAPFIWIDAETGEEYEQVEARVDNRITLAGHGERFHIERENDKWVRRSDAAQTQSMDLSGSDEEAVDAVADQDMTGESQALPESTPDHQRLGVVSWNVQHFSNHDVQGAAKELERQLKAFDVSAWSRLFEEFSAFAQTLRDKLGKDRADDVFKGLQNGPTRAASLGHWLSEYDEFVDGFDIGHFAKRIEALSKRGWSDEIKNSDDSQATRVLLRKMAGEFKYVEDSIGSAVSGFRIIAKVLGEKSIIERLSKPLARSLPKLSGDLRKVRDSIVNKTTLDTFRKALHSHNIVVHIDEMFANNDDWLDVVVLQEINDPRLLESGKHDYTVHQGPHMKSNAGRKHGQNEYYPLLIRNDSGVEVVQTYLVKTNGELDAVTDDDRYAWKKTSNVYRPIMAYHLRKKTPSGSQDYLVGVVHTTPEVDGGLAEFNRRAIYDEVSKGLAALRAWAAQRNMPLIVGGDYYLSAEAVVREPTKQDLQVLDPLHDNDKKDPEDSSRHLSKAEREDLRHIQNAIEETAKALRARRRELQAARSSEPELPHMSSESPEAEPMDEVHESKPETLPESPWASPPESPLESPRETLPQSMHESQEMDDEPTKPQRRRVIATRSVKRRQAAEQEAEQAKENESNQKENTDMQPETEAPGESQASLKSHEERLIAERLKFLAAAKTDAQIIRNVRDLTVKAQVERLGLYLSQAISGTNPKADPLARWFDLQIADFFIHNKAITGFRVGIVRPEGGMVSLDREDLYYSRYWQHFSDHFPVGGIYSVGREGVPGHLGRQGQYSKKAVELARVSNVRRFARLALIRAGKKPDLSDISEERVEALAVNELHARINKIRPSEDLPTTVEECLRLLQFYVRKYGKNIPANERVFVTEPEDFEPDYTASGAEELPVALPPTKTGLGATDSRHRGQGRFLLDHRQALQSGWNCGDLALQVNRDELVAWLLQRANDPLTRALLAPEIRTAAAASFMSGAMPSKASKEAADEKKLKEMFLVLDETKEEEVRSELAAQIEQLLKDSEASAPNRHGLPDRMITAEIGNLLQDYYDAHEAMAPIVSQINDSLQFHGENRLDGTQLLERLEQEPDLKQFLDDDELSDFEEKMSAFKHHDDALTNYTKREDVFRDYVTQYYGREGWMVYHLQFGGEDQAATTSVIDLAAQYRRTQVRIWVYRDGGFKLNRETAQYGQGVINILYNGYNHFIGLTENPDFMEAEQEQ